MYIVVAVGVDQNDRLALQETKRVTSRFSP